MVDMMVALMVVLMADEMVAMKDVLMVVMLVVE